MNLTEIARTAHAVDRAYRLVSGDDSPTWEKDSAHSREAWIISVRAIMNHSTPETMHELWSKELARLGWSHGEKFDVDSKTHPNLVAYADLPFTTRCRDALIVAVVRGALGIAEEVAADEIEEVATQ